MNRKKFLCLIVATLIPTTASAQLRESVAVDHPFAAWSLDERDSDVARNLLGGPHGKFVAGVNSRPGVCGSAANFSGKRASRVAVAMSDNVNGLFNDVLNGSFTLELWLLDAAPKADGKTNHSLIYKADRTAFTRNSLWLYRARQDAHYHFRIHGTQDRSIQLTIRNPAGRDMAGDSRWHHVVIVIDRNNPKPQGIAYLDGKQVDRTDIDAAVAINNTEPLIIGNNHFNASPWLGGIDEVSIYDAALSAERIKQHFAAGQRELERRASTAARVTLADFFELKIRPLLIDKCATCHSGDADSESVLAVNSRRAL